MFTSLGETGIVDVYNLSFRNNGRLLYHSLSVASTKVKERRTPRKV